MNNEIPKEVMLYLLCFQALEIAEELDTAATFKKSLRTLKTFTNKSIVEFEKTELGSEYQARSIHNFNVVMSALNKDILLTPIGEFEVK